MPVYCDGRPCDRGSSSGGMTSEGGVTISLINKTGSASVKGTVVIASTTIDDAFDIASAGEVQPIGVVLDDGIADGSYCRVVISGRAQVLLEDAAPATRGYWVEVATATAGRATMLASPNAVTHWAELGHCLESVAGGTDVLAWCNLHFN